MATEAGQYPWTYFYQTKMPAHIDLKSDRLAFSTTNIAEKKNRPYRTVYDHSFSLSLMQFINYNKHLHIINVTIEIHEV